MWDYTDKVKDFFENPRNVGEVGRIDGVGEVGSLACGDALRLTIQVDKSSGKIEDARFQTFGCASAIASSSALTEMIRGLTTEEALNISNKDIADYLGGLPKEKMHCSVLGREAMEAAIANYLGQAPKKEEGEIICECFGVTDRDIERVVMENDLTTLEEVTDYTKAGGGCGSCHEKIEALLYRIMAKRQKEAQAAETPPKKLTNLQKIKLIEETIEREIRPALKMDGGDIELVDVDGNHVMVTLKGTCSTCAASQFTLTEYVEQKLKEFVTDEIMVVEVKQ
ncbi:MAG: Fe-S cluster assembly protein NifU [Deltaproteobacteria bacterium]|nr:Fe-S cluster assembly protein NifU [Deltaproteobacteria bacterium]